MVCKRVGNYFQKDIFDVFRDVTSLMVGDSFWRESNQSIFSENIFFLIELIKVSSNMGLFYQNKYCQFLSFDVVKNIVENCSPRSQTSFHQCSTSREISHILVKSCSLLHLCYNLHKGAFGDNLVRGSLDIHRWYKQILIKFELNWKGVIRNIYNMFIIRHDFLQGTFVQCM
jgi:hypothetical protein